MVTSAGASGGRAGAALRRGTQNRDRACAGPVLLQGDPWPLMPGLPRGAGPAGALYQRRSAAQFAIDAANRLLVILAMAAILVVL